MLVSLWQTSSIVVENRSCHLQNNFKQNAKAFKLSRICALFANAFVVPQYGEMMTGAKYSILQVQYDLLSYSASRLCPIPIIRRIILSWCERAANKRINENVLR